MHLEGLEPSYRWQALWCMIPYFHCTRIIMPLLNQPPAFHDFWENKSISTLCHTVMSMHTSVYLCMCVKGLDCEYTSLYSRLRRGDFKAHWNGNVVKYRLISLFLLQIDVFRIHFAYLSHLSELNNMACQYKISANNKQVLTTWRRALPLGHVFVLLKSLRVRDCFLNLQESTI